MTDPKYCVPLAKAGHHAMAIPDSIAQPQQSESTHPYTEDGNREFLDRKAFIETFALIGALSAVTMHGGGDPAELDPLPAKLAKFRDGEDRIGLAEEFQIHVTRSTASPSMA